MTPIHKVPLVFYTYTLNVSGYFDLTIMMTLRHLQISSINGTSNRVLITLPEPSNEERTVFINKSGGGLTINFPLSICLLALQLLHFLSLFMSKLRQ